MGIKRIEKILREEIRSRAGVGNIGEKIRDVEKEYYEETKPTLRGRATSNHLP